MVFENVLKMVLYCLSIFFFSASLIACVFIYFSDPDLFCKSCSDNAADAAAAYIYIYMHIYILKKGIIQEIKKSELKQKLFHEHYC